MARARFFERMQTYMKSITQGNENKLILRNFNCTISNMDRDDGRRTQKLYGCRFSFVVSKLIMDNGLEDPWRRENLDTSEFTRYDRSSSTRSRIDRVYTDVKITNNTKLKHEMISFADHYNAIPIDRFPSKTKIGKHLGTVH